MGVVDKALTVYETYLRSEKGIKMPESHWDNKVVPETASMLKEKYQIKFDSEIIPTDKKLIKNLYLAGLEMLVTTGIFNADTGRVVRVTESEVKEGIKKAPKRLQFGEYRDAAHMEPRKGNSSRKPIIQGGPTGATVSEDVFIPMIQSYAQESVIDTIVNGVMATIDGMPATTNTPFEIKATLAEIRAIREACNRAGRPYMGI
jgi:methylamine--corrinoid protein Co-methyltransferase